jgi:hypothetical protein
MDENAVTCAVCQRSLTLKATVTVCPVRRAGRARHSIRPIELQAFKFFAGWRDSAEIEKADIMARNDLHASSAGGQVAVND